MGRDSFFRAGLSHEQGVANCQSSLPSCEMQRNFPFKFLLQLLKLTTTKQERRAEYTSFYFCILFLLMKSREGGDGICGLILPITCNSVSSDLLCRLLLTWCNLDEIASQAPCPSFLFPDGILVLERRLHDITSFLEGPWATHCLWLPLGLPAGVLPSPVSG